MSDPPTRSSRTRWFALAAFLMLASTWARIDLSAPKVTPDSQLFFKMADNLRAYGCLSQDDPANGTCAPAWGSQPPGYTVYLAAVRSVTTHPSWSVVLQVMVFAVAAWALATAVPRRSDWEILPRLVLMLLSPLTFAWGRWILTETLATAATMIAFAVFARVLRRGAVEMPALVAALTAALLLRWDLLCLLAPAAMLVVFVDRRRTIRRVLVIAFLVTLPYQALSVRAWIRGLSLAPGNTMDLDLPPGILRFWRSTALDQRATTGLIWPSWSYNYADVATLDLASISPRVEAEELKAVLSRLSSTPKDADFPPEVDRGFERLVDRFESEHGLYRVFVLPCQRMYRLWANADLQFFSGWDGLEPTARAERARTFYRMALLISVLTAPLVLWFYDRTLWRFSVLVLVFVVVRTAFLVVRPLTMIETRYLTEFVPILEVSAMAAVAHVARNASVSQESE